MQRSYFYGSHDQRAYDYVYLHPEALRSVPLYIGVLSFRGPKSKGLTSSSVKFSGLTSLCLYTLRGFTPTGLDLLLEVLTSKGFTNRSISSRVVRPGILRPVVLRPRVLRPVALRSGILRLVVLRPGAL